MLVHERHEGRKAEVRPEWCMENGQLQGCRSGGENVCHKELGGQKSKCKASFFPQSAIQ